MRKLYLLLAVFLCALSAHAVSVTPVVNPHVSFVDASGNPCAGCKLFSYAAGTTNPLATYTDSTGIPQNTNPITLDASGSAQIWFGANSYKLILKTAAGTILWTVDNVNADAGAGIFNTVANISDLRTYTGKGFVNVIGYYSATVTSPPDGGGGVFIDQGAGASADDGGVTIYDSVTGHNWKRQYTGTEVYASWFGIKPDNSSDNSAAMTNVFTFMHAITKGGKLIWPGGGIRFATAQTITSAFVWQGNGKQQDGENIQLGGSTFFYTGGGNCAFNLDPLDGTYGWENLWIRDSSFFYRGPLQATQTHAFCAIKGSQLSQGGFEHVASVNWPGALLYFKIGLPVSTTPITGYISDGTGGAPGNILCVTAGSIPSGAVYLSGAGIPDYTHVVQATVTVVGAPTCTGGGGGTAWIIDRSLNLASRTINYGAGSSGAYYQNVKFSDISTSYDAQFVGSDPTSYYNMRVVEYSNINHENAENFSAGIPDAYFDLAGQACWHIKDVVFEGSADSNPNLYAGSNGGAGCSNSISGTTYTETGTVTHPLNHLLKVINSGYTGPIIRVSGLGAAQQSTVVFDSYVQRARIWVADSGNYLVPTYTNTDHNAYNFVGDENNFTLTWGTDVISRTKIRDFAASGSPNPWGAVQPTLMVDSALTQPFVDLHGQWLDGYSNGIVSIGLRSGATVTNEGMISDADEGRVFELQSNNDDDVRLEISVVPPPELVGSQMVVAYMWKLRTVQGSYTFSPLNINTSLADYPQNAWNYPTACGSSNTNTWNMAFATFEATAAARIGISTGGCASATGTQYLDIAAVYVGAGTQVPYTLGGGQAKVSFDCAAAPTYGTYVVGDSCTNSVPAVGQPTGWVNTVAGSPGTWTALYASASASSSGSNGNGRWVTDSTGTTTERGCISVTNGAATVATGTITFPLTFPTALDSLVLTPGDNPDGTGDNAFMAYYRGSSTSGATAVARCSVNIGGSGCTNISNTVPICWIAIGR